MILALEKLFISLEIQGAEILQKITNFRYLPCYEAAPADTFHRNDAKSTEYCRIMAFVS